jgi:hypothetical protein
VTEPTPHDADRAADRPDARPEDLADAGRSDESRDISDVGLPHPGDDAPAVDAEADEAAIDEVFPAAD